MKVFDRRAKEMWIGIGMGIFALIYLFAANGIERKDIISVGAEFMPFVYGTLLLIVSVIQAITGYRKFAAATADGKQDQGQTKKKTWPVVVAVFALMIITTLMMKPVGFVISGSILTFGMCILLTPNYIKRNYVAFAIFSIVLTVIAYYIFKNMLYVSLPSGILPF